jgi:hypothetical protein
LLLLLAALVLVVIVQSWFIPTGGVPINAA